MFVGRFVLCAFGCLLVPWILGAQPVGSTDLDNGVLSWEDCLLLALKSNPDVQKTKEQLEQLEGNIIVQTANFLPKVTAGAQAISPTVGIGLAIPVYSRAEQPTFAAFPFARQAAWANAQLALMEMAYQLRVNYVEAYYDQELVPVARQELELLEDRVRRAPSLYDAGKMTKADLESLQVREALAKSKVESAVNLAETSRLQVLQITGLPAGDPRLKGKLITDFKDYVTKESDPEKLVALALKQRQDLQLLRNLKKVNEQIVLVNAANYYPVLGAGASLTNDFQPPNQFTPLYRELDPHGHQQDLDQSNYRRANVDFEMVANWRIFDGGATTGNVMSAKTVPVTQAIMIKQIEDQIPRQVALALEVANGTETLIDNLKKGGQAEKNLQTLQRAYEAGQVSQVEILDAQDEFILYKEDLLKLESGHEQAMSALDRIVGLTFRVEATLP